MIEARGLTKRYGSTTAVHDLSFQVASGKVTGFLGPNGAGKSTTMRMVLGLDRADAGSVRIDHKRLVDFDRPLCEVGALLDAGYLHPTRKARDHLWALAASNGLPKHQVDHVLGLVGLTEVANKRVGNFSLGMKQRLGLAASMLGDPETLVYDEPANGLDPEGVRWVREFVRHIAAEGRTVLLSSHLMSEMALAADHVIVLGRGQVLADAPIADLVRSWTSETVLVRSPELSRLVEVLRPEGASATAVEGIQVTDEDARPLIARLLAELQAQRGWGDRDMAETLDISEAAYKHVKAGAVDLLTAKQQFRIFDRWGYDRVRNALLAVLPDEWAQRITELDNQRGRRSR